MKFLIPTAMVTLFAFCASPQHKVEMVEGLHHPESVDASGSTVLIADIGTKLTPGDKDGDGAIKMWDKYSAKIGEAIPDGFHIKSNAPKGIASYYMGKEWRYTIYADITQLSFARETEHKSGPENLMVDMSKYSSFLNDVAPLNDSIVFVSATDRNCIYRVNINYDAKVEKLPLPAIKGANGLCLDADKKYLYCVGWGSGNLPDGEIWKINLQNNKAEKLGSNLGYLDGCGIYKNRLYFSDWVEPDKVKGRIRYLDFNDGKITTLDDLPLFGGPADFYIDTNTGAMYLPTMLEGKLYRIGL